MKRGVISSEGGFRFRISKPGIDVDSAGPEDFLFHESYLFTQPYHFTFVPCPFAGNTGRDELVQDVRVHTPNGGSSPLVILYPVSAQGLNVFPTPLSRGTGNSQSGFTRESWSIYTLAVTATYVDIQFYKPYNGLRSPQGCYLIMMRRPT